jgi:hypothetical protein
MELGLAYPYAQIQADSLGIRNLGISVSRGKPKGLTPQPFKSVLQVVLDGYHGT